MPHPINLKSKKRQDKTRQEGNKMRSELLKKSVGIILRTKGKAINATNQNLLIVSEND